MKEITKAMHPHKKQDMKTDASCAFYGGGCAPKKTQPATFIENPYACVGAYAYLIYIKIKLKKKNIPIGLRPQEEAHTEKYAKTQPELRVTGCAAC